MSSWNYYDQAENHLKAFTRSAVRTKIMLCLKEGGMTAAELEKEMNIRASTILHAMKEMIEAGLVPIHRKFTRFSIGFTILSP